MGIIVGFFILRVYFILLGIYFGSYCGVVESVLIKFGFGFVCLGKGEIFWMKI